MRVDSLSLRNFKCYGEAELDLERGVTVVHGVNGSGKSTLLEAVFFALYGSKALDDRTLDDVITTGEETCGVELAFTHANATYRIERELTLRGDRATTTTCVLETPEGSIEGARDVRAEITHLLRMDAEAFVNCAYVRQGEVNKLIHASPRERQDMIDDLLQLGALEEYRERASEARLGVKDVLDRQAGALEQLREQIERKEDKDLHERLNELESRRADLDEELEHYERQQAAAEATLEEAIDILERHEETREEIETLEAVIADLRSTISETEREREELLEKIGELEDEREAAREERSTLLEELDMDVELESEAQDESKADGLDLEAAIEDLEAEDDALRDRLEDVRVDIEGTSNEIDTLRARADELETEAEDARADAQSLADDLEAAEAKIDEQETTIAALEDDIEDERALFDDAPIEFGGATAHRDEVAEEREEIRSSLADVSARVDAVEASIEEGEALLEAGKCPECGQPVEESPHVDVLTERREEKADLEREREELANELETVEEALERAETLVEAESQIEALETRLENVTQLLAEKRRTLEDRRKRREELQGTAEDLEATAETKREAVTDLEGDLEAARDRLGDINRERATIRDRLETCRTIRDLTARIDALASEADGLRERRASRAELNEERRERLSEKREQKRELQDEFDASRIEDAREERENAEVYIEQVEPKLETIEADRESAQNAIGAVKQELTELEELHTDVEHVEERCEALQSLYDEAETLQTTYGDLRAELRQRNVDTLERLLNETFELVYQNDSYASIDLDGEYRLTVYQKDGETLEPEQLSGGERALFNLSLRCAIYRLLAEGVEGAAPMPPLILDEPTVFLDSGHVTQLVSLIESMRQLGVEQIVVVSHDEELVGAADDLVRVEKDATSNRSRLERGEPPEAALLAGD